MNQREKDIKFIKKGKLIAMIFGLLSIMNIIILIGKNSSYALFRRNVQSKRVIEIHTASEFPFREGLATDIVKKSLGKPGGIIGVTEDSEPTTDKGASNIREYRYSGLGVNNYVKFNDETWRIIGIFKDENNEEHVKIIRSEILAADAMPDTYEASGEIFKIRYNNESMAYWNYDIYGTYNSNWVKGGLKYWLNSEGTTDGYLKSLINDAQNMIAETKYYLGNVYWDDTAVQSYENERKNIKCSVTSNSHDNNCYIWPNNEAIWIGKIGLMYQSDYRFSAISSHWSTITTSDTSWLYKEANLPQPQDAEWFLSPSSFNSDCVAIDILGGTNYAGALGYTSVRPTLYLKSNVKITGGDGSINNQYKLSID